MIGRYKLVIDMCAAQTKRPNISTRTIFFGKYICYNVYNTSASRNPILLTKITAVQTEDALSYYRARGLYFLAVVFVATLLWCISRLFS